MPASLGRLAAFFTLAALAATAAACGSKGGVGASTASDSTSHGAEDDGGPDYHYEAYAEGLLADTLRGAAEFGRVFNPQSRREYWVLSMHAGSDVSSGLYLARSDTTRPRAGTYEIVRHQPPDQEGRTPPEGGRQSGRAPPSARGFSMIYRAGMRRSFASESGTLKLTTATDTLVEGTFQANFRGTASRPGQPPQEGQLRVRGSFRAEKGTVGFVFGI